MKLSESSDKMSLKALSLKKTRVFIYCNIFDIYFDTYVYKI